MIRLHELSRDEARTFSHLTFPELNTALLENNGKPLVTIGAAANGEPVGLAFGMGGDQEWFELASVYVAPFFRDQGIGTELLAAVEQGFIDLGYSRGVHLFTVWEEDQAFARFLVRQKWSQPTVRQVVCKTNLELAYQTPWLVRARLPESYRTILWCDLNEAQRSAILERQAHEAPWYPDDVDPFRFEPNCHVETSVALLKGDRAIGWVITHVLDSQTLRWTCSYVSEELQGAARILPLWWAVAQRQKAHTQMEQFIWTVPVTLPRMVQFARRRMRPWLLELGYACTTTKEIAATQSAVKEPVRD